MAGALGGTEEREINLKTSTFIEGGHLAVCRSSCSALQLLESTRDQQSKSSSACLVGESDVLYPFLRLLLPPLSHMRYIESGYGHPGLYKGPTFAARADAHEDLVASTQDKRPSR